MPTAVSNDILDSALRQPEKERARIAETLIASLDTEPNPEIEQAWQREIDKRLGELGSGSVTCIPWEEVRDRLSRNAHVQS
jgi:putative addiction module component (TIGR02574 family)